MRAFARWPGERWECATAVVINVVTRVDQSGIRAAQKQLSTFANKAALDMNSTAGGFIRLAVP